MCKKGMKPTGRSAPDPMVKKVQKVWAEILKTSHMASQLKPLPRMSVPRVLNHPNLVLVTAQPKAQLQQLELLCRRLLMRESARLEPLLIAAK
eukprot:gene7854-5648_t